MPTEPEGEEPPQDVEVEEENPIDLDAVAARAGFGVMATLGFALGALTDGGLWTLYPTSSGRGWLIPVILVGSSLVVGALSVFVGRRLGRRAGDWLVAGYALAIVGLAVFVIGGEAAERLRWRAFHSFAG